jgi:putative phosphoribosyl transferase
MTDAEVVVDTGEVRLAGALHLPLDGKGVVVFAHGQGSGWTSPRNRFVATRLHRAGYGTLLFDLLTAAEQEQEDVTTVPDIAPLARRLGGATRWLRAQPVLANLPFGWFGASTGAAVALWAASDPDADATALVCRSGRPDLAADRLALVRAPTLLIVGSDDDGALVANVQADDVLRCEHELRIVPGASHLFPEPGTLEQAAELSCAWFTSHLPTTGGNDRC